MGSEAILNGENDVVVALGYHHSARYRPSELRMAAIMASVRGALVWLLRNGKLLVSDLPSLSLHMNRFPDRWVTGRKEDTDSHAGRRGLIMSFGTFFTYYDEHLLLDASDTAIGLIGGVQAFMTLLLSFFVGRFLDAKCHRSVVAVGGVLTWLGYFCLSFNHLHAAKDRGCYGLILLTQSIIAGAGMSCFFMHSSHCAIQVSEGKNFCLWQVLLEGGLISCCPLVVPAAQIFCGRYYFCWSCRWCV